MEATTDISTTIVEKHSFPILDKYFKRIGYKGKATPTLETLRIIHQLHAQSIPFENLNPFLKIPVLLDIKSLEQKILEEGRGGYCFELNGLLKYALETIGFHVKTLGARVMWNLPENVVTARGHMLLLVELNDTAHIADVGFGGLTLTSPLQLIVDVKQETPHESFRIIQPEKDYILQAKIRKEWKSIYKFDLNEQYPEDYEVSNWYLSNNPTSHFVTGLIAARPSDTGRYILRGNEFTVHQLNGTTNRRIIKEKEELKEILIHVLGIKLPNVPQLEETLDKVVGNEITI